MAVAAAALPTDAVFEVFTPAAVRVLVPGAGPADCNPAEAVAGFRAEAGSRVPVAEDEDEDGAAGFPLLRALLGLARLLAYRAAFSRAETAELAPVGTPAWSEPVFADDEVWGLADDEAWGLAVVPVCFRSLLELGHDDDEDKELSAAPFA